MAKAKKIKQAKKTTKAKAPVKKIPVIKETVIKPAKNKWNRKELEEFRKRILGRKNQILDDLGKDTTLKQTQKEASGDISGYTYHMADVATDNYDREFSLGIASNERQVLYELDDAVKRIEDGSYGICEDCKAAITKTRLKAIPYTRHCLKCQEKRETR